jgi:hypothetical protein
MSSGLLAIHHRLQAIESLGEHSIQLQVGGITLRIMINDMVVTQFMFNNTDPEYRNTS